MITMNEAELRALQLAELDLLREADRICSLHGIRYQIIAGTLLGAVRHGGFIPWDDDADIAMLRPEYERFRTACRRELDGSRFVFQDHRETEGYRWGYGKLRMRGTLFLREYQEHMPYEQGIFIDVFPLDAVPDSFPARAALNAGCFFLRKALWSKVGQRSASSPPVRGLYGLLARIPEKWLLARYDALVNACRGISSGWVRILLFPTPDRHFGYRRRWYEKSAPATFEGCVFPGIAEWDEYLRFKYGDYETLPPPEKRRTHPVSALWLPEEGAACGRES